METRPAYQRHDAPELSAALARFQSINELIDHWAAVQPDRAAFIGPRGPGVWSRTSWSALLEETLGLAAGLLACGVRTGEHVGILADGDSYVDCLIAYLAILRCGAVMVPLNPRHVDAELQHAINFSDCTALLVQPKLNTRIALLQSELPQVRHTFCLSDGIQTGGQSVTRLTKADTHFSQTKAGDLANIVFTSGTTAQPKAVMHTHGTALATGAIFSAALGLRNSDTFHHAIPFFTSSGTQFAPMPALWVGATLVVEPRFDAAIMLQRIENEASTAVIGVPSHYLFILEELERKPRALHTVRLWDYGGAPMPARAVHELAARYPHIEQRQQYGLTETGPSGTVLPPDQTLERIGSAGRPMPLCEIRIVDDDRRLLSGQAIGQIAIRSPACMRGYYKNDEANRQTLEDGWVHTGDIGWMDEEGYLYYSDRTKDIINRGGLKISSIEVEDVLYSHPDVLEAAVVSMPHEKLGEDVMAFVVPKDGALFDAEGLRAFCIERLADYKSPRHFACLQQFPRNSMGKIQKSALRDLLK